MIADEKLKLRANYLNGVALALFAVGGLAPFMSFATGVGATSGALAFIFLVGGSGLSAYVHVQAQRTLEGLTHE